MTLLEQLVARIAGCRLSAFCVWSESEQKRSGERDLHIAHSRRPFICTILTPRESWHATKLSINPSLPERGWLPFTSAAETICANCRSQKAIYSQSTSNAPQSHEMGIMVLCAVVVCAPKCASCGNKKSSTVSTRDAFEATRAQG